MLFITYRKIENTSQYLRTAWPFATPIEGLTPAEFDGLNSLFEDNKKRLMNLGFRLEHWLTHVSRELSQPTTRFHPGDLKAIVNKVKEEITPYLNPSPQLKTLCNNLLRSQKNLQVASQPARFHLGPLNLSLQVLAIIGIAALSFIVAAAAIFTLSFMLPFAPFIATAVGVVLASTLGAALGIRGIVKGFSWLRTRREQKNQLVTHTRDLYTHIEDKVKTLEEDAVKSSAYDSAAEQREHFLDAIPDSATNSTLFTYKTLCQLHKRKKDIKETIKLLASLKRMRALTKPNDIENQDSETDLKEIKELLTVAIQNEERIYKNNHPGSQGVIADLRSEPNPGYIPPDIKNPYKVWKVAQQHQAGETTDTAAPTPLNP